MTRTMVCGLVAALVMATMPGDAAAQPPRRFSLSVEGGSLWSARNDVRIPPDTGTEFSLAELIGSRSTGVVRIEVTADLTERHGVRFVYAPLRVTGRGISDAEIRFAGGVFGPAPTDAEYQFTSYRATYRYRIHDGATWRWHVGFTGFVRDARIALSQPAQAAEDTDVGFVPLGYLSAEARLTDRWRFGFDVDGSAAPQGRAFDVAAGVTYQPASPWEVGFGWRTIEGGADVSSVYTFAWLNAAVARVTVHF
jgi:hypothetical protein